jgi:hypothetical protein
MEILIMAMLKIERKIASAKATLAKVETKHAADPESSNPETLKRARKRVRDLTARRKRQIQAGAKAVQTKGQAGLNMAGAKAALTRYVNKRAAADSRSDKISLGKLIRAKQAEIEALAA